MKNLKAFKDCCFENKVNEQEMNQEFMDAFDKYIKGQVVKTIVEVPYKNVTGLTPPHGEGLEFENGYKYISYGGGCSGNDCNTVYIVGPDEKLVASYDWDGI